MGETAKTPGAGKPVPIKKRWREDERFGLVVTREPTGTGVGAKGKQQLQ